MIPKEVQADSVTQEHKNYNTMTKNIKKHIETQGQRVKEILEKMFKVFVDLDNQDEKGINTSFLIDFDEIDMYYAASIFFSVCSNYAIKHGYLTEKNGAKKIAKFRKVVNETFGLDVVEVIKTINNTEKTQENA